MAQTSYGTITVVDVSDGAQWYSGTAITNTSVTPTVFANSGITYAVEGDMYLNTSTNNTYRCTLGGNASTAKWVYINNIKGQSGQNGVSISSIVSEYCLSSSSTSANGNWSTQVPSYISGYYYWTRQLVTWSNNTTSYSPSAAGVLDNSLTDANRNAATAVSTANTASQTATEAAKTATKYITKIDDSGIKIQSYDDTNNIADTDNYIQLDANGLDIYKNETSIARYGENVRIGAAEDTHIEIDSNSLDIIGNNNIIASFGERVVVGNELSNSSYLYLSDQGFEVYSDQQERVFYIGHGFERASDLDNTVNFSSAQGDDYYPSSFEYDEYINTEGIENSSLENVENLKYDLVLGVIFQHNCTYIEENHETSTTILSKTIQIPFTPSTRGSEYSFTVIQDITTSVYRGRAMSTARVKHVITINPITTEISVSSDSPSVIKIGFYKCDYQYKIPIDNPSFTFGIRTSDADEGEFSFAVGSDVQATNFCSYAEGKFTESKGRASHAEGLGTIASGPASHAEGYYSKATGDQSHAEGSGTASGKYSHAEGSDTIASGQYSHAQNTGTKARSEAQTAIGKFNVEDTNNEYALIIGNGTYSNRSNALTVDWNGNVNAVGSITQNGTAVSLNGHTHSSTIVYEDVTVSISYSAGTIGTRGTQVNCGTTARSGYKYIGASILSHTNTSTFSVNLIRNDSTTNLHLMVYRANGNAVTDAQVTIRKTWIKNEFASAAST